MKKILQRWLGIHNESVDSSKVTRGTGLFEVFTGLSTAGTPVSETTAMMVSAVYASVNLIGGAIASMPVPVYRRTEEGRERLNNHPYWYLLNRQPEERVSAAVFWEYLVTSLLLNGDAFARIIRPSIASSKVIGLRPYHKANVEVLEDNGRLLYKLYDQGKLQTIVDQADMIHIPGPGFDGKNGKSQIRYALRNAAGVAIAADEYSSGFFKNGARPDFALEFPGNLTEEQQTMIRNTWSERFQGASNAHKPALLTGGAKVHELTINAEDSQLLETRKFQVEDIARIFGVPPHMIGHTEKSTSWGTGVEQMSIGFVKYTLQRHLVKIEQELNRKLFGNSDLFVKFNTSGLERGDYKTRNEGYRIALGRAGEPGWMSVDEVRKLEDLPPMGGDFAIIQTGSTNGGNS